MSEHAFPLQWPIGWPRAKQQRASAFKPHSIEQARVELMGELRMLRSQNPVLSSNLVLREFVAQSRRAKRRALPSNSVRCVLATRHSQRKLVQSIRHPNVLAL
jgi:hypothetical protein